MSQLLDLGTAGVLVILVIIFLNYITKRDTEWREYFTELNKMQRDFFTVLNTANSTDLQSVTSVLREVVAGQQALTSLVSEHDRSVATKTDGISVAVNAISRVADGMNTLAEDFAEHDRVFTEKMKAMDTARRKTKKDLA